MRRAVLPVVSDTARLRGRRRGRPTGSRADPRRQARRRRPRRSANPYRRHPRRARVGARDTRDRLPPAAARGVRAGDAQNRSALPLRRRDVVCRRGAVRPRTRSADHQRAQTRLRRQQRRRVRRHSRHLSGSPQRFGFLTNPGGAQRESLGYENGRRNDANWHGVWYREDEDPRRRLEPRVRHPVQDAAVSGCRRPGMGDEHGALGAARERNLDLGASPAPVLALQRGYAGTLDRHRECGARPQSSDQTVCDCRHHEWWTGGTGLGPATRTAASI